MYSIDARLIHISTSRLNKNSYRRLWFQAVKPTLNRMNIPRAVSFLAV